MMQAQRTAGTSPLYRMLRFAPTVALRRKRTLQTLPIRMFQRYFMLKLWGALQAPPAAAMIYTWLFRIYIPIDLTGVIYD
jgi:hypothetical protein